MSSQIARMREAQEKRLVQHEFRSPTLGVVVDAYQRPEPLLQTSVLLNPLKLFKLWWQKTRSGAYTLIAQTNASRSIPGYDKLLLRGYIADLYKKINEAQAKYQLEKIKDVSYGSPARTSLLLLIEKSPAADPQYVKQVSCTFHNQVDSCCVRDDLSVPTTELPFTAAAGAVLNEPVCCCVI